jgi:hypothetical protein
MLFVLLAGVVIAQESMIVTGTLNSEDQLVDEEGVVYDIVDTEQGAALLEHAGEKVTVVGTVEDTGDAKMLTVESFELVDE